MFPTTSEDGKFSPSWLYSGLADLYEKWLPGEEQQATLRQAGYFTVSMSIVLDAVHTGRPQNFRDSRTLPPSLHLRLIHATSLILPAFGPASRLSAVRASFTNGPLPYGMGYNPIVSGFVPVKQKRN